MDLKTTLDALRTGWHLMFIGLLVGLAAAVWIDADAQLEYTATASYVVSPGSGIDPDDVARGLDTLDSSRSRAIMVTFTEITDSASAQAETFAQLGLDPALSRQYRIESVVVPEANVMETSVTGPNPEIAARLASTLGLVGGVRFVEQYQIYDVDLLDTASVPTEPSTPALAQLLLIAGALGLMGGAAVALVSAAMRESPRRSMDHRLGAYRESPVRRIDQNDRYSRTG